MFNLRCSHDNLGNVAALAVAVALGMVFSGGSSIGAQGLAEGCRSALPVSPGGSHQGYLGESGTDRFFYVDLPAAGILTVEVEAGEVGRPGVRLGSPGAACHQRGAGPGATTIEMSAKRRVIASPAAGRLFFSVAPGDLQPAPGDIRWTARTRFAGAEVVREVRWVGSAAGGGGVVVEQSDFYRLLAAKNEPEEVDPDPDKRGRREPILTLLTARAAAPVKNEPEEVDPDPDKAGVEPELPAGSRRPVLSARLALFTSRLAGTPAKNEPEEVDPDPDKSARLVSRVFDGLLAVGEAAAGEGSPGRRGLVSFRVTGVAGDGSGLPRRDALIEWLAEMLRAEIAWSRLVAPGAGGERLRLLEYDADPAG